jgi:hypothetical protein
MKTHVCLIAAFLGCATLCACASRPAGSSEPLATGLPPAGTPPIARVRLVASESFSPETGAAAVKAFVPDVAPTDSGGECRITKLPGSSNATIVAASFPNRATAKMNVSLTFDSVGHLVRYGEVRGYTGIHNIPPGTTEAQRDSMMRAAQLATRSTSISLDYAIGQAILHNRGGGLPDHAVLASPRDVEGLAILGPIKERLVRVRKLCGV